MFQSLSRLLSYLILAQEFNFYNISQNEIQLFQSEKFNNPLINITNSFFIQLINYTSYSRIHFNSFIEGLVINSFRDIPIFSIAESFLNNNQIYFICNNEETLEKPINTSLKSIFSYNSLSILRLLTQNVSSWINSSLFCQILLNGYTLSLGFKDYSDRVIDFQNQITFNTQQILVKYEYLIFFSTWIIIFFVSFFILYYYLKDLKDSIKLIKNLNESIKYESSNPIKKGFQIDNISNDYTIYSSNIVLILFCSIFLMTLIAPILFYLNFQITIETNINFRSLSIWMMLSNVRQSFIIESLERLILIIFLKNNFLIDILNYEIELDKLNFLIDQIEFNHKLLMTGNSIFPPFVGQDELIDKLHFQSSCVANHTNFDQHENYKCSSINQAIILFKTYIFDIISKIDQIHSLSDPLFENLFHLTNSHLLNDLIIISNQIDQLNIFFYKKFQNNFFNLLIISIISFLIIFIINFFISLIFDSAFNSILIILRRLPPNYIINDEDLLSFILDKKNDKKNKILNLSEFIIFNSINPILFLSKNGNIELINNSLNKLLGFVPEQLLGQSISSIISEEDKDLILNKIILMKNKQCSNIFEDHIKCINDSNNLINVQINIYGFISDISNEITFFVIFLKDENEIIQQKNQSELFKKKK